jgi:hypothetical protein
VPRIVIAAGRAMIAGPSHAGASPSLEANFAPTVWSENFFSSASLALALSVLRSTLPLTSAFLRLRSSTLALALSSSRLTFAVMPSRANLSASARAALSPSLNGVRSSVRRLSISPASNPMGSHPRDRFGYPQGGRGENAWSAARPFRLRPD